MQLFLGLGWHLVVFPAKEFCKGKNCALVLHERCNLLGH